jgi:hypothetical protein
MTKEIKVDTQGGMIMYQIHCMTVLMSKTSYVYRKKMLCFNSTPSGSHNSGIHFFYKHLTSSRSNFISRISIYHVLNINKMKIINR